MTETLWISKLGFESLHPSQNVEERSSNAAPAGLPAGAGASNGAGRRFPTLVDWAFAPEWMTPAQAAQLLGESEAGILALIDQAAIVAEEDGAGGWLVERRALREFQEALLEVLTYDQQ